MNQIADAIKKQLTSRQVAEHYGFRPNCAGFIPCPFHNEKEPSLKLFRDDRGWWCFGCQRGGSVIDFVMEFFHEPFYAACMRLNMDFGLGLLSETQTCASNKAIAAAFKKRARKKHDAMAFVKLYLERCDEYRNLLRVKAEGAPHVPEDLDVLNDEYVQACHELPELEWWLDENINTFGDAMKEISP